MKTILFSLFALTLVSSASFATPDGDKLYDKSFVSVNKGDCTIDNANDFAPRIDNFKIMLQTQALQQQQGEGFLYYNMLGTSVGVMTPARYAQDKVSGQQSISSEILVGLASVAQVQIKTALTNGSGDQKSHGTIAISKSGKEVFNSTFTCN